MKIAYCGFQQPSFKDFFQKNYDIEFFNVYQMKDFSVLKDYDAIFLYMITGLPTEIPLENLAAEIKKQIPKPMIGFFDWEVTKTYNSIWRDTIVAMDRILYCGPINKYIGWHKDIIINKTRFMPIPFEPSVVPNLPNPQLEEIKWVASMLHTSPNASIEPTLKLFGERKTPLKLFAGTFGESKSVNGALCHTYGLSQFQCFNRLEQKEYFNELSKCYVGFDNTTEYAGWSRFVTESAMFGIPVISNDGVSSNVVANPDLVCYSEYDMMMKLRALIDNKEERDRYGKHAKETLLPYISYAKSKIRFDNILNEVIRK